MTSEWMYWIPSATSKIYLDSALNMSSGAKSAQVFESQMSNEWSSFSTEKESRYSCMATQGTYEKLLHLRKCQEMARRARDLEIATSKLLDRNPIKQRSAIGIR